MLLDLIMKNLKRTPLYITPFSSNRSGSGSTLCIGAVSLSDMNNPNLTGGGVIHDTPLYFQYYSNQISSSRPAGWVSLKAFIEANRNPKPHIVYLFNQIAHFDSIGDTATKSELKEHLYSFTPCVNVSEYRRYANITKFTGLLVLDFDKITNALDFKEYLFESYNCIIASWLSPSKRGVKALVKIPVVSTTDEFKSYYYGIAEEMQQYNGFDPSGQNCVLPLFQSIDPDLLYRNDAVVWTAKGINIFSIDSTPTIPANPVQANTDYEKILIGMINTGIDKIDSNGHPQLRSLCLAIGGYVANNYINYNTALDQINYKIENNNYLKKGISGYKKSAKWAVSIGMNKPLTLNEQ